MAIQTQGFGGVVDDVDTTFRARRTTIRPAESVSWCSVGAVGNAITGVAAAGAIFSFRNLAANLIIVRRVQIGFVTTTAFTTAQGVAYRLFVARAFTASDTGGNAIAFTGSNAKHRTSLATLTSTDCRMTATGALTAGTRTLDANSIGAAVAGSNALAVSMPMTLLFSHDAGDYPLVLAQNEGFVITNDIAMGAAGVLAVYVNVELAEATSY
jgi:hypothetical protein